MLTSECLLVEQGISALKEVIPGTFSLLFFSRSWLAKRKD
jgi:hypothetical protein